jgi:hypothetical protein
VKHPFRDKKGKTGKTKTGGTRLLMEQLQTDSKWDSVNTG